MKDVYRTSQKIFDQVTSKANPVGYKQLRALTKKEIIVVEGEHDHIEKLLGVMKIPYTLINSEEVEKQQGGKVMFVNCRDYSSDEDISIPAVRRFVGNGGRLVSTDWSVDLVTKAFPGKIKRTEEETEDDVVEIRFANELGRKLIGLNYVQCHPKWWLEGSSYVFKITGKDVVPIITSGEMESKYGNRNVMVGFPYQQGEVFHFISHLELQRTKAKHKSDGGKLEDFLKKIGADKSSGMGSANVAELESAFSSLNTLAYLCLPGKYLQQKE